MVDLESKDDWLGPILGEVTVVGSTECEILLDDFALEDERVEECALEDEVALLDEELLVAEDESLMPLIPLPVLLDEGALELPGLEELGRELDAGLLELAALDELMLEEAGWLELWALDEEATLELSDSGGLTLGTGGLIIAGSDDLGPELEALLELAGFEDAGLDDAGLELIGFDELLCACDELALEGLLEL